MCDSNILLDFWEPNFRDRTTDLGQIHDEYFELLRHMTGVLDQASSSPNHMVLCRNVLVWNVRIYNLFILIPSKCSLRYLFTVFTFQVTSFLVYLKINWNISSNMQNYRHIRFWNNAFNKTNQKQFSKVYTSFFWKMSFECLIMQYMLLATENPWVQLW